MCFLLQSALQPGVFLGWVCMCLTMFPLQAQPSEDVKYVWTRENAPARFAVAEFKREIELDALPGSADLHLFADSRYQLYVNGAYVNFGPSRFYPAHPRFDTYDLLPFLRVGQNEILVKVVSNGTYSFQQRRSRPGFIAWGNIKPQKGKTLNLSTPGSWQGRSLKGYDEEAIHMSFALGPMEIHDARISHAETWEPVSTLSGTIPWGNLQPRNIPPLTRKTYLPQRMIGQYPLKNEEDRWFFRVKVPDATRAEFANGRVAFGQTYIYSPKAQSVEVGLWWGEHYLNGKKLEQQAVGPIFPHRQTAILDLEKGWNHFWVRRKTFWGKWDFMMAAPKAAGLVLSAEKQTDGEAQFVHTGPLEDDMTAWMDSLPKAFNLDSLSSPKVLVSRSSTAQNPAIHQNWQQWQAPVAQASNPGQSYVLEAPAGEVLVFDMGRKMLGSIIIEYEAPAGTIVDIGWSEDTLAGRPRLAKRVGIYPAARRISTQGSNTMETLKPYGLRYVQVQVTGASGPVNIHRVAVREQVYPFAQKGDFRCSDPRLTAIWQMGWRTLRVCAEDSYTDTPFRERGLYAGDMLPQQGITLAGNGDMRLVRRSIELFLDMYRDLFYPDTPRHPDEIGLLEDYPLLTLEALRWYADRTQDWAFVDSVLPAYIHLVEHELNRRGPEGYVVNKRVFIEWTQIEKSNVANAAYHALLTRSCEQIAYLAEKRNQIRPARRFSKLANQLREVLHENFWDESAQAYRDGIKDGREIDHHYPISSAWPLLFDLVEAAQIPAIEQLMREKLVDIGSENRKRLATPYGGFYLLLAMGQQEMAAEAERFVRQYWGPMIDRHDDTAWENFGDEGMGTLSHAWSAGPTYYLTSQLLGVDLGYPEPVSADTLTITPLAETVDWAEGTVPLPEGELHIRWEVIGEQLLLHYEAPAGLEVKVKPRGRLGDLRLVIN